MHIYFAYILCIYTLHLYSLHIYFASILCIYTLHLYFASILCIYTLHLYLLLSRVLYLTDCTRMDERAIVSACFPGAEDDLWVPRPVFEERLEWLRACWRPESMHCDDLARASEILSVPAGRWLSVDDAVRMMNIVHVRYPSHYTRIAIQKMIVIRTLYPNGLPVDMFSIGLCYYGYRNEFHIRMDPGRIREILLTPRWSPPPSGGSRTMMTMMTGGGP